MESEPKSLAGLIAKIKDHERTTRPALDDMRARATRLREAARNLELAWSGSNFGYHWDLYYRDFQRPALGHRFSVEWGGIHGLPPGWGSRTPDDVKNRMEQMSGTSLQRLQEDDRKFVKSALELQEEVMLVLQAVGPSQGGPSVAGTLREMEQLKWDDNAEKDYLKHELDALPHMTRDSEAFAQGLRIPSHASYAATVTGTMAHCDTVESLWKLNTRLSRQVEAKASTPQADKPNASGSMLARGLKPLEVPEKVSLSWLFHNVPWRFWSQLAGLLLAAFLGGVYMGQVGWIRQVVRAPIPETEPRPEKIEAQIDQLTKGYNERVAQLQRAIVEEEGRAAAAVAYLSQSQPHMDAAKRLRQDLKDEEDAYRKALEQLRSMRSQKP